MSDSEAEDVNELQDFTLVEFVRRGRKRKVREIDVVPSKWLEFDKKKGRCVTKFLDAIDNEEDVLLLHNLVKTLADPPEDWSVFSVELKGRAKSYEEALEKLNRLNYEENVFTGDSENSDLGAKKKIETAIKQNKLLEQVAALKTKMLSSQPDEADGENSESDADNSHSNRSKKQKINNNNKSKNSEPLFQLQYEAGPSTSNAYKKIASLPIDSLPIDSVNNLSLNKELIGKCSTSKDDERRRLMDACLESVPIIDATNVPCTSAFEIETLAQLNSISEEIAHIKRSQNDMKNFLIDKKVVAFLNHTIDFNNKYNLQLPLKDLASFMRFNENLKTNNLFRHDVFLELRSCMDKDFVITRSFQKMLRTFVSKEVAVHFTAVRKSRTDESKILFNPTEFCNCMKITVLGVRKSKNLETLDKDLISGLSDVLCNVKNWDKKK